MTEKVKAIPEGFHTITPHLAVRGATQAIEFYKNAFGAQVRGVSHGPGGSIMHALLQIGDSFVMLADEFPGANCRSPQALGGTTTTLHIYVEDVDSLFNRAATAGAKVTMPLMDAFWGDRYGQVVDPFGHTWSLATHKQDIAPEEVEKAGKAFFEQMSKRAQSAS